MSSARVDTSAVQAFIDHLPRSVLDDAPQTHLPTQLPLAFPSPLHIINVITMLHLVRHVISQPRHAACLAELRSAADDLAVRGVLGLYLASDETWSTANLLSCPAWRASELNEAKVAEFFGIQVMREREHESMPGVRVGERWTPGVRLVADLVDMFQRIGTGLQGQCCIGERVKQLSDALAPQTGDSTAFARRFCQAVKVFDNQTQTARASRLTLYRRSSWIQACAKRTFWTKVRQIEPFSIRS